MTHALPSSVLEARDAFRKNPQRRRKDIEGRGGIGEAPNSFSGEQRRVWGELLDEIPLGLLTGSDRKSLETLCKVYLHFNETGDLKCLPELRQLYTHFGMTPLARAKLPIKDAKPQTKFSEFKRA